jgi:transposase
MRTSLNEIAQTEKYLTGQLNGSGSALFQAKMILNKSLTNNVLLQRSLMDILAIFHRRKIREEVKEVHDTLFSEASHPFPESVYKLFNP